MEDNHRHQDHDEIPQEWKELVVQENIQKVDIEIVNDPWMVHPKKKIFINWKDDSFENGRTVLIAALEYNRADIANTLLENGADPNIVDADGCTPLMYAGYNGYTSSVKLLLEKNANPNVQLSEDNEGDTALLYSARENHTEAVGLMLKHGADPNILNSWNESALHEASKLGNMKMVELLLNHGADLTFSAFLAACDKGKIDVVGFFVAKGMDPNTNIEGKNTALETASSSGHFKVVALLIAEGADLKLSPSALWCASAGGHIDLVAFLLEEGADPSSFSRWDALLSALQQGHNDVVKLLQEKGADINVCNDDGQTYLHLACLCNNLAQVKKLLDLGADKDKTDNYGHTALFYASEERFFEIVEFLLVNKADVHRTDERRHVASTGGQSRRSHISSRYSVADGRTPLFIAAEKGYSDIVDLLLQHGADPYLCNDQSKIPSQISILHAPVQERFRIHDYFAEREPDYQPKYRTCKRTKYEVCTHSHIRKNSAPPLESIIHEIVKYPHYAEKFFELYQENREIINWLDKDGRTVRQVACKECRDVTLFMAQYDLDDQPIYESPTCKIYNALDHGGPEETNQTEPKKVVMKFMEEKEHYENEIRSRRNDDGSPRFSSKFVTPHIATYNADHHKKYAESRETWKPTGADTDLLSKYCLVLERGERSLLESMNAENLSSKAKDLQRREILLTLCNIFSYLHEVGYIHGDVKPHNAVRHTGTDVTWKAIDFDACTKIGDAVGLKLTTGSAPPEMVKIVKRKEEGDGSNGGEPKILLRQPGAEGLDDESDLVLADPSFDVWQYGILMYHLVTGRSFFHSDLQGNLDHDGLRDLASLTQGKVHEKLTSVKDVNARVLLSRILRLDPKERPTVAAIGKDYYFHPSEAPQGRKAEFFGKQVFDIFVPQVDGAAKSDDTLEEVILRPTFESNETSRSREKDESNDDDDDVEDVERFISSKSEFSYFKLRDEDKDWSDKLLHSEVEMFRFDNLGGMGKKPKLIDGDTIYDNNFLRSLLSRKGPDYFMGFLVEYFGLYNIIHDAHEVCQGIKANLVSDVKSLQGIFIKLFVRGKGLNDCVRATLFCNTIDQFTYVGRQLKERYGHNVYIKPPKKEAGSWPIPKLLVYGENQIDGRCMSVEIQFSTVYMHLALHASNSHVVYEAMRESTGYLGNKAEDFQEFTQSLNERYIDTEGFLRNQSAQEGRFEILAEKVVENDSGETVRQYIPKSTGFILSGRIRCGDRRFQFVSSATDHFQKFSESSFVVNKNLTLLSSHSYWSEESYALEGKSVEFVVSFKGRGLAIAGIGTTMESNGGGARCSVHVGRSKFVVRRNGVEEVSREKKLPNQERAKIIFKKMKDGTFLVSFVGSGRENDNEEVESAQVTLPPDEKYYLYMRAPPGVHDVKFHDINIVVRNDS